MDDDLFGHAEKLGINKDYYMPTNAQKMLVELVRADKELEDSSKDKGQIVKKLEEKLTNIINEISGTKAGRSPETAGKYKAFKAVVAAVAADLNSGPTIGSRN